MPDRNGVSRVFRWLASASIFFIPLSVRAETLPEAIADAYRNNPQLQAQRAQQRALDETVIQALSPYRLRAQVDGNLNYDRFPQQSAFTDDSFLLRQRSVRLAMNVSQLLTSGGRVAAQVSAAEAEVLAGREALRAVENDILYNVVDAYVAVRRDQQLVAIQQLAVAAYERQVAQNAAREAGGDLAMTDVTQAEAQLLIIRAALAQAEAGLQSSRARFAVVVGRNPGALDPPPPLPYIPESPERAQDAAGKESPRLWQARFAERASRRRIAAARAEYNPTLSAQAGIGYQNPRGFGTADLEKTVSAGLTLTVPVYQQGLITSRIRSAIAQQQAAQFGVETVRRDISAATLNAWNRIVTAQAQLRIGRLAVTRAEAALGGVKRGFAEGFRSNFEVIDSEQRLLNARSVVVNAEYALEAGQAELLATIGRLQAATLIEDVAAYDPETYLEEQRRKNINPLLPVVRALDRLSEPGDATLPPPVLAETGADRMAAIPQEAPNGPLATNVPVVEPANNQAPERVAPAPVAAGDGTTGPMER